MLLGAFEKAIHLGRRVPEIGHRLIFFGEVRTSPLPLVLDFGDQTSDLICCLLPFTSLFVLSLNLCSGFLAGQIPKALLLLPVDLFLF